MRLLSGLNEIACLIPDSFYEVCEMIKPLIPEEGEEKKLRIMSFINFSKFDLFLLIFSDSRM